MFNTYGIHSINRKTFNMRPYDPLWYPREVRNVIITALRINNALLNVLGYLRMTSIPLVSGCARIAIGAGIIGVTLAIGERDAHEGAIIGRWYDEAIVTGVAQVARGILEAFVPFGWAANLALDVIATPSNLMSFTVGYNWNDSHGVGTPHDDVHYPFSLSLLGLA